MDWRQLGFTRKQLTLITTTILATTIIIGAIIGYFLKNSTKTPKINYAQEVLPLPKIQQPTNHSNQTQTFIVAPNESLTHLFKRASLPNTLQRDLLKQPIIRQNLTNIRAGETMVITTNAGELIALSYTIDDKKILNITKDNHSFKATIADKPKTAVLQFKSAIIDHNLAETADHAGLSPQLFKQLKTMFAGKIDFSKDIQSGDQFKILYQEYYVDGKKDRPGDIVAAEMDVKHHQYRAIRFDQPHLHQTGYYTPNGEAVSSLFLKVPVIYEHISSHFNYHRLDPVLHRVHPHLGLDLAAPRGTPVKALGDGRVLQASYSRGYGNTVIIRYNTTYKTLYGHLEKYAKGLHANQYVTKGQVVGYVGSTGWATGPHLHFEIYKNGKPVDPLKLPMPNNPPLPKKYHDVFLLRAQQLLSEMQLFEQASHSTKKNG